MLKLVASLRVYWFIQDWKGQWHNITLIANRRINELSLPLIPLLCKHMVEGLRDFIDTSTGN